MKNISRAAIELLKNGEDFVQATILSSEGSTPRGSGTSMLLKKDGDIIGTIGGGPLEGNVMATAPEVFAEKKSLVRSYVFDGNDAAAVGAICGGSATVLIDYIKASDGDNLTFFEELYDAVCSGSRSRIVTIVPESGDFDARTQCVWFSDGTLAGTGGCDSEIIGVLEESGGSYHAFTCLENRLIYITPVGTNGTVYIFGAGHCGQKLSDVLYPVGFETVVIDDREEFCNVTRFPNADRLLVPENIELPFGDTSFDGDSYIVIVTRGHAHDETVLRHALRTDAYYIGMIGSSKKRKTLYERLLADGYKQEDLDRVYSPIGLDIGADSPEEIAISIAGELIKARAKKRGE